MRMRIYSNQLLANVALLKQVLEERGISCEIRREYLSMVSGEVPPIETWPELWILDKSRASEAGQRHRSRVWATVCALSGRKVAMRPTEPCGRSRMRTRTGAWSKSGPECRADPGAAGCVAGDAARTWRGC